MGRVVRNGALGGQLQSLQFGEHQLDLDTVVSTWFNSDLFHTRPQSAENLSLEELATLLGGADQARAILAMHLISSLQVVNGFFKDVAQCKL